MQYPGYDDYESPPPTSYFRRQGRPWSPDPQDSLLPLHHPHSQPQRRQDDYRAGDSRSPGRSQRRRREPSEQSVEALDLADYNAIVQARSSNNNYAPFPPGHFEYPPSPPPARPFSVASRETPSLVSSPDTLSSQSPAHSYQGHPRSSQSSRPFSLPPPRSSWTSLRTPPASNYNYDPHIRRSLDSVQERPFGGDDAEVDISRFPAWSRDWYAPRAGKDDKRRLSDRSFPRSPEHAAFFDPARASDPLDGGGGGGRYDPNFGSSAYGSSNRDRDLLPWSQRDMTYGAPLDEETKEERLQMLEREFGPHAPGSQGAALLPERVVGSVNEKGSLITEGPRKRLAARILELLLALAVVTSSFYALLAIHPKTAPPPQGKPSTYALYALSIISVLAFLWFFFLRPCCGRRKASSGLTGDGPAGLAVLPVHGLPGGKPPKKGKRGKKGRDQQAPVQVNLIVDPTAFMPGGMPGNREEDEDEDGESGSAALLSGGRRQPKRRGVFEGLAMERAWKVARKELKWMLAFDILCVALWAVEFVWVVIGDKCTPGAFDGWCNAFNVATASACILAFTFALSVFFDIKDLHQSSRSPRTRP